MLHYNFPILSVANFANPVCLGWEVKKIYRNYAQNLLSVLLHFPPVWSQVQVSTRPPLVAHLIFAIQSESDPECRKPLFQRYLVSHTSAWSSIPDRHPPFRKDCLLVDHNHIHRVVFSNGATDWSFSIFITQRTDVLFVPCRLCYRRRLCYRLVSGNHRPSAQETWCTELWRKGFRNSSVVYHAQMHSSQLDKHPHHNFL
jgi:hypothetical protein